MSSGADCRFYTSRITVASINAMKAIILPLLIASTVSAKLFTDPAQLPKTVYDFVVVGGECQRIIPSIPY